MSKKFVSWRGVAKEIKIVDIAQEFGIQLEPISSGNFNYRCVCPSKEHKGGYERTPSCYIDSVNNNFHCFGCSKGTTSIDFYILCAEVDFATAMSELNSRVDTKKSVSRFYDFKENNFLIMLDISKLFRMTMLNHPSDLEWVDNLMKVTEPIISRLESDDIQGAKNVYQHLKILITERYSK